MRPVNCGFRSFKGIFIAAAPSTVNPVNKLCSLAFKVQQTFFVTGKKKKKRDE